MKIAELLEKIEKKIPKELALPWDNVGLLVGDGAGEVTKVYIALDATDEVVEHAIKAKAELLLTHHPLIFSGIKNVTADDFIGRRIIRLLSHNISCYAMHTNFDVQVMGLLAGEMLGLSDVDVLDVTDESEGKQKGIGCVATLPEEATLIGIAKQCKKAFGMSQVKIFGAADTKIKRVAISPGAGKSEVATALLSGADVLLTGDIDHHTGIDAVAQGLQIIDAGHYGIEHIYITYMEKRIKELAPELAVETEPFSEPFWML